MRLCKPAAPAQCSGRGRVRLQGSPRPALTCLNSRTRTITIVIEVDIPCLQLCPDMPADSGEKLRALSDECEATVECCIVPLIGT
jgi:hypothetical protein